ncbi:MAG TPA: uracil-DNA glycosylase [Polyangia bacterium]|nr:uracil-DNA glycosylase [Polyangia bacterium]
MSSEETSVEEVSTPRQELREIVARTRTLLELRGRSGLLGVRKGKTIRRGTSAGVAGTAMGTEISPTPTPTPTGAELGESAAGPIGAHGLTLVREEIGDCQRCRLSGGRKNIVFGVGNPQAHLVFVGEAPGADEDQQGEPFVGKAGQLLTKMIEAMGYRREDVYICNVIKCRPPGNRNPEPDEVAACEPFLKKQLASLRPRMIVTLGKFAAQCLLRDDSPISRLRGNFRSYEGISLMPTFHPAYLLRDPSRKKEAWADLKAVNAALKRLGFEPPHGAAG